MDNKKENFTNMDNTLILIFNNKSSSQKFLHNKNPETENQKENRKKNILHNCVVISLQLLHKRECDEKNSDYNYDSVGFWHDLGLVFENKKV